MSEINANAVQPNRKCELQYGSLQTETTHIPATSGLSKDDGAMHLPPDNPTWKIFESSL